MRLLAIGECMAELAPLEKAGDFRLGFAGDTFNTAWYVARVAPSVTVSYFTAVGDDALSGQMREAMREGGIDDSHVQVLPGRTIGLYLISLTDGERSFSYWRGQSAARQLADDAAALEAACREADLLFFSGITLAILDAPARSRLLAALAKAREAGKVVAFDPNLRPRLWAGGDEMTGAIMQGAAVADIALPSFEDEAEWFGDADPEATADRYISAGAGRVVVKNGAAPVLWRDGEEGGEMPVTPVAKMVDTTAAGDSFNAAILAGALSSANLADSIASACRLAGLVVQKRGALVPVEPDELT